ncbi:MAG: hypothetical protein MZW92_45595 [Comamonadaceae bacterium]|nr:hypothetical protein [Comamonadaceae bacterium]
MHRPATVSSTGRARRPPSRARRTLCRDSRPSTLVSPGARPGAGACAAASPVANDVRRRVGELPVCRSIARSGRTHGRRRTPQTAFGVRRRLRRGTRALARARPGTTEKE